MIRSGYLHCIVALLVLMVLVGGPGTTPRVAGQATAEATASVGTPAPLPTFGSGLFSLVPTAGLTDLSSYQATLKLTFKGNTGGKADAWNETLEIIVSREPFARSLKATFKGNAPAAAYIAPWSAAMNGMFYQQAADGTCGASIIQANTDPNTSPVWEPADFLPGVMGAEESGAKTVNGVAAKGYKFDERALGVAGRAKASGEVWVADPDGYVLKYSLSLTGSPEFFGEGGDGTLTWTYDITKIDQPAAIKLPKGCPSGLIDAPVVEDAEAVRRLPGATLFTTHLTIAQVADFYQEQLPSVGWKLDGKAAIGDKAGTLNFKQGNSRLTVFISLNDAGTSVRLLLVSA